MAPPIQVLEIRKKMMSLKELRLIVGDAPSVMSFIPFIRHERKLSGPLIAFSNVRVLETSVYGIGPILLNA